MERNEHRAIRTRDGIGHTATTSITDTTIHERTITIGAAENIDGIIDDVQICNAGRWWGS